MTTTRSIAIVGCGSAKTSEPAPVRHLYTSQLFQKSLRWAEANADHVVVASALHNLLELDQVVKPYEFTHCLEDWRARIGLFGRQPATKSTHVMMNWTLDDFIRAWGVRIIDQLISGTRGTWIDFEENTLTSGAPIVLPNAKIFILAGEKYCRWASWRRVARRWRIKQPLAGKQIGERLGWLTSELRDIPSAHQPNLFWKTP